MARAVMMNAVMCLGVMDFLICLQASVLRYWRYTSPRESAMAMYAMMAVSFVACMRLRDAPRAIANFRDGARRY